MTGIRLEWAQFGDFDSFDVIRSNTSMENVAGVDLPDPIATELTAMYYIDTSVVEGSIYFYKVRVNRDSVSLLSSEIAVQAGDDLFNSVELLIFADSTIFPTTVFTDSSLMNLTLTAHNALSIVNTEESFFDDGWIYFDNTNNYLTANKYLSANLSNALLTNDFTFEMFVKPNYSKSTQYGRIFAVGTHSTDGMISVSKADNPWTIGFDMYSDGWSSATKVATPPKLYENEVKHVCLMRKNGVFYVFVGGELAAIKSDTPSFSVNQTNLYIGTHPFNNGTAFDSFGGYMSSIRLTHHARYSETGFEVPNVKFPGA